jgi:hypothetical protein
VGGGRCEKGGRSRGEGGVEEGRSGGKGGVKVREE